MAEEDPEEAVSPPLVQAVNREAHMAQTSRAAISFFFIIWKSTFRMKIIIKSDGMNIAGKRKFLAQKFWF